MVVRCAYPIRLLYGVDICDYARYTDRTPCHKRGGTPLTGRLDTFSSPSLVGAHERSLGKPCVGSAPKGYIVTLTIDRTTHRSPNYDSRPPGTAIEGVVIHTGEGTKAGDISTLTSPSSNVSAHYYVDRAGKVYELVSPQFRAWHAGVSSYMGRTNWNNFSIGIESEHKQGQDWPAVQKDAYAELVEYLIARYPIKQPYVAAHRWIAPTRRSDPTDWPDRELIPWIDHRFDDVWALRWGPIATPDQTSWDWDIPRVWKINWQRLGFCIGSALYDQVNMLVVQSFEGGDVRQRAQRLPEVCFR